VKKTSARNLKAEEPWNTHADRHSPPFLILIPKGKERNTSMGSKDFGSQPKITHQVFPSVRFVGFQEAGTAQLHPFLRETS
jgi:hypothetical protein